MVSYTDICYGTDGTLAEVMVTYEASEKILFSADGFGKFGALSVEEDWTDEARRYFINIVGKYGAQVQNLLKKRQHLILP